MRTSRELRTKGCDQFFLLKQQATPGSPLSAPLELANKSTNPTAGMTRLPENERLMGTAQRSGSKSSIVEAAPHAIDSLLTLKKAIRYVLMGFEHRHQSEEDGWVNANRLYEYMRRKYTDLQSQMMENTFGVHRFTEVLTQHCKKLEAVLRGRGVWYVRVKREVMAPAASESKHGDRSTNIILGGQSSRTLCGNEDTAPLVSVEGGTNKRRRADVTTGDDEDQARRSGSTLNIAGSIRKSAQECGDTAAKRRRKGEVAEGGPVFRETHFGNVADPRSSKDQARAVEALDSAKEEAATDLNALHKFLVRHAPASWTRWCAYKTTLLKEGYGPLIEKLCKQHGISGRRSAWRDLFTICIAEHGTKIEFQTLVFGRSRRSYIRCLKENSPRGQVKEQQGGSYTKENGVLQQEDLQRQQAAGSNDIVASSSAADNFAHTTFQELSCLGMLLRSSLLPRNGTWRPYIGVQNELKRKGYTNSMRKLCKELGYTTATPSSDEQKMWRTAMGATAQTGVEVKYTAPSGIPRAYKGSQLTQKLWCVRIANSHLSPFGGAVTANAGHQNQKATSQPLDSHVDDHQQTEKSGGIVDLASLGEIVRNYFLPDEEMPKPYGEVVMQMKQAGYEPHIDALVESTPNARSWLSLFKRQETGLAMEKVERFSDEKDENGNPILEGVDLCFSPSASSRTSMTVDVSASKKNEAT
ncbi:unnamed protein product [Amoebophrya sp. A25]|nr:unnamed protein product [Amoebophrya sp. A25]|eukprot:GSA25T00022583001.1